MPNEFAFLLANLFGDTFLAFLLCVVENIKLYTASHAPRSLRDNAVFAL